MPVKPFARKQTLQLPSNIKFRAAGRKLLERNRPALYTYFAAFPNLDVFSMTNVITFSFLEPSLHSQHNIFRDVIRGQGPALLKQFRSEEGAVAVIPQSPGQSINPHNKTGPSPVTKSMRLANPVIRTGDNILGNINDHQFPVSIEFREQARELQGVLKPNIIVRVNAKCQIHVGEIHHIVLIQRLVILRMERTVSRGFKSFPIIVFLVVLY